MSDQVKPLGIVSAFADALVDAGSAVSFEHDGLIYPWGVPPHVVEAYVAGRAAKLGPTEMLRALVLAHVGPQWVAEGMSNPRWLFWRIGRAWGWRLGQLERQVRGLVEGGQAKLIREEAA